MDILGKRIYDLRKAQNMTLEQVGSVVGVGRSTVRKWETGMIANMRRDKIAKLAEALHTSPAYIMGWTDDPDETATTSSTRIPVLGAVPAGIPLEAIEVVLDWEEIPAAMCAGEREYFGLQVKGDSMYPLFLEGDVVIVRRTPCFESGDICVVYVNGYDATLKQVKVDQGGAWTLLPKNPEYPPRTFSPEEIRTIPVSIAGVVVELRRKMG